MNFSKAPITEVVFDIQAVLPQGFDYRQFEEYHKTLENDFPTKEVAVQYEASIEFKKDEEPAYGTKGGANGFHFKSVDGKKILQFKNSGFTFNKLKPYQNWETFSSEAKKHFEEYIRIAQPIKIIRVGLRYINKLEIPLPIQSLKEYITTVPTFENNVPSNMDEFFMRLVVPYAEDPTVKAIITEAMLKTDPAGNVLPIIFDIDVFKEDNFELDIEKIYNTFDTLRNYKNFIFLSSITDKMKKLII